MSAEATRAVWDVIDTGALGPTAALVALHMARRADPATGEVWAATRKLARLTGLSAPTVSRALREVTDAGPFTPVAQSLGTRPAVYVLACNERNAKQVVHNPLACNERNAKTDGAYITRDAHAAKEQQQPPTGVVVAVPVQTVKHKPGLPEPETDAEAERLAARADALALGRRHAEAAKSGDPLAPIPKPDDWPQMPELWPEDVTRPEDVPAHMDAVRARIRPRKP